MSYQQLSFEQSQAVNDEIRLALNCIRSGLLHLKNSDGRHTEYFVPALLIASALERLFKVLLCFDALNQTGSFPSNDEMKQNYSHKLVLLHRDVITVIGRYPLYQRAPARIDDLNFLSGDKDLISWLEFLDDFARASRYWNLDVITGKPKNTTSPEGIFRGFRDHYWRQKYGAGSLPSPHEWGVFYKETHGYLIRLTQRLVRAICFMFTQGPFGSIARQYSAGLLDPFLLLRDDELDQLKFDWPDKG